MKIAIAGTGYVGLSLATLLSQNNEVIALDVIPEKVEMINNRISPIKDEKIEEFFKTKELNLKATLDYRKAFVGAKFIIISTPTNYDDELNFFDTSSVEDVIEKVISLGIDTTMVVKSTIPVGFIESVKEKYGIDNIMFSPEFLREGKALYDNLYPSRIIVGEKSKRAEEFADIVSRISRYANTQNKVNDADFTANNAHLVAFEKLSRYILTPITEDSNIQTYWFFERARGQYKNFRQKEGFTKSRQAAFDLKYPKKQVITKVELAKYINAYEEVYDGKKIAIGPFIVVRGNEKNYSKFINNNLPENIKNLNSIYYEDAIAKTILFRTTDKRYGTKVSGNNIGELKQVVVPYAISLLTTITKGKLNLYKIWKNQCLSNALSDFIYELMKQINDFILKESPVSHYIEWSKKEECWEKVKAYTWSYDLNDIKPDLINSSTPARKGFSLSSDENDEDVAHDMEIIESIPYSLWRKIAEWGKETDCLSINYQSAAQETAHKLKFNHKFTDSDRRKAINIYNIVCEKNIDLLFEADKLASEDNRASSAIHSSSTDYDNDNITIELVQKMVEWDRRRRVLKDWQWKVMDEIAKGKRPLDERMKRGMYMNYIALKKRGFTE